MVDCIKNGKLYHSSSSSYYSYSYYSSGLCLAVYFGSQCLAGVGASSTSVFEGALLLRESMVLVFWGAFLSILVDVFIVNLFSIFLVESATLFFSWNSLAKRKAVARASFLMLSILLFLQPSIVVQEVADPMPISFPRQMRSNPPTTSSSPLSLHRRQLYMPSKLLMVITSSMHPTFSSASSLVLEVIEGPPLTSSSQAFPLASKIKSKPQSQKEFGELVTSFWTASRDFMMQRWMSQNA